MPLFLGVMIQDMREQSTNLPISKLLVRVVVIVMVVVKEKLVGNTTLVKILGISKQDFSIISDSLRKMSVRQIQIIIAVIVISIVLLNYDDHIHNLINVTLNFLFQ